MGKRLAGLLGHVLEAKDLELPEAELAVLNVHANATDKMCVLFHEGRS